MLIFTVLLGCKIEVFIGSSFFTHHKRKIRVQVVCCVFKKNTKALQETGPYHTHTASCLPLLPSGPDGVRSAVLYETRPPARPCSYGGERGIRTLGTVISGTHDFQSCPFGLSGISPHATVFVLAEREGFEPPVLEKGQPISSRPRYDHFGTSPYLFSLKKAFIKEPA